MKTPPLNLNEIFQASITELCATEKKYLKVYEQLARAAMTPEISAALSPERTDLEQHTSRLTMIIEQEKLKASRIVNPVHEQLIDMSKDKSGFVKQKSLMKDIQILHWAKLITQVKINDYESLHSAALALKLDKATILLEQCVKDEANTYAYLLQIGRNIIYPAASGE
ncbi:DUF892 family protein [Pedobacter heparinus]|uniref:DUF892 family protein n=1 Tax=Pedobacter heparinus TaxID=984 RepID=UPI00292CF266|nr:DUF892 family protein [Pedobacter heparinus]